MSTVGDRITALFLGALVASTVAAVAGVDVGLPGGGGADAKGGERTGLIEGETLRNAMLHDCTVRNSTLELTHVENCTVEASTLKRSTVVESTLRGATIVESGVSASVVEGGEARLSSLIDSHVRGVTVEASTVRVTDHGGDWAVVDSVVRKSRVENHTMRGGELVQATAVNTRLEGVHTDQASVELADLRALDARREGDAVVVTVENVGDAATYHFEVAVYDAAGSEVGRARVEAAPAGGAVDVSVPTGGAAPAGGEVVVDVADASPESNEGNNRRGL